MTEDSIKLPPIGGSTPVSGPGASELAQPGDPAEFRRLLERLQKLAKKDEGAEVTDVDQLEKEMMRAEDEYRDVMDFRKLLEEAYQRRQG